MTHSIKTALLAAAALSAFATPVFAQSAPTVEDLQRRIEALSKDLAELKAKDATRPTVALPNGKPAIAAPDGKFTANLRTIVMVDAGKYFQDDDLGSAVVGRDLNSG